MNLAGQNGQPNGQRGQSNGQPMQITPDMVIDVNCSECENDTFRPLFYMKKVPKFVAQSEKDIFTPVQTWECAECGNINSEFQISNMMSQ